MPPKARPSGDDAIEAFSEASIKNSVVLDEKYLSDIPDVIYHYTSIAAFMDIVRNKVLWASRAEFLNDANEFQYGKRILQRHLKKMMGVRKYRRIAERITGELEISVSPFVACFCQDGDLLSQWRGYSTHGQGIAIALSSETFADSDADLNNVLYDREKQEALVKKHLTHFVSTFVKFGLDLTSVEVEYEVNGRIGQTEQYCALLKDPAFSEENEIRLSVQDYEVFDDEGESGEYQVRYRSRNNLVIPFIEIGLPRNLNNAFIEIVLGPGPDPRTRKRNVEHFLKLQNLNVPVRLSSCQLRT